MGWSGNPGARGHVWFSSTCVESLLGCIRGPRVEGTPGLGASRVQGVLGSKEAQGVRGIQGSEGTLRLRGIQGQGDLWATGAQGSVRTWASMGVIRTSESEVLDTEPRGQGHPEVRGLGCQC